MIQGLVGADTPIAVNFLPSRGGLATIGFTVLDKTGSVVQARTSAGVKEVVVSGMNTGVYQASVNFAKPVTGVLVWDTGQSPLDPPATRLRVATEEITINYGPNFSNPDIQSLRDLVGSLAEENTMKVPDMDPPSKFTISRKRPGDPDWSNPISKGTLHIIRQPGQQRFGGPSPS